MNASYICGVFASVRLASVLLVLTAAAASGQSSQPAHVHQHDAGSDLFTSREASGTAWVPENTPMDGLHWKLGSWHLMLHGRLFLQVLHESGDRRRTGGFEDTQFSSANWAMLMARRPVGSARVGLRAMLTAEPWTVANCGFINHLASGEMCQGDTIHDRQHPHDTFMELAVDYDRPFHGSMRWQLYAGLAGEPALGPAGFPHRSSAAFNPIAPVTHHWLDSTHVSFGVVTAALYGDRWKLETSVFNGREPDERRTNIEFRRLDSVSARVAFAPNAHWALQVSGALLTDAEQEFAPLPRSDVNRGTASASYHGSLGPGALAATLAYGVNGGTEYIPGGSAFLITHGGLAEASLTFSARHTLVGRVEAAGKPGHDLHVHEAPIRILPVGKTELGYVRHLSPWRGLGQGIGATLTANILPDALAPRYNGHVSWGIAAFFTIGPKTRINN